MRVGRCETESRRVGILSREENDLLSMVGPGTPMGELMRRYWIPALLSEEISEAERTIPYAPLVDFSAPRR